MTRVAFVYATIVGPTLEVTTEVEEFNSKNASPKQDSGSYFLLFMSAPSGKQEVEEECVFNIALSWSVCGVWNISLYSTAQTLIPKPNILEEKWLEQ